MGQVNHLAVLALSLCLCLFLASAQTVPRLNYYANSCPNVERIVTGVVKQKVKETFVTIPATLRLFFHDCLVQGCDASVMIASTGGNTAEKDHPDNLSLAGDGFDTVIRAKKAIDAIPSCRNKVSCADILALATRDVVVAAGGPNYSVELGRLDGLSSTSASVNGKLPKGTFNLDQLNAIFKANGLDQNDLIALSAAHSVGFAHCSHVAGRIYGSTPDRTLDPKYANDLRAMCPRNVDPRIAINMDPNTPRVFDNVYYKNLQQGKGLFTSDQVLWVDPRSRPTVNSWASNKQLFEKAFVTAMTKLGRVGVKTGRNGNIRRDCGAFN